MDSVHGNPQWKRIQNIFSEYEIDEKKSISIDNISFNMEIFNSKSDSNNKIRDIENTFVFFHN